MPWGNITFLNVSNEELFETNEEKNIKFRVFTQKKSEQNTDLTDTCNKAMNDPDSEMMTAKYYEPEKNFRFTFKYVPPLWWIISINGWKQT